MTLSSAWIGHLGVLLVHLNARTLALPTSNQCSDVRSEPLVFGMCRTEHILHIAHFLCQEIIFILDSSLGLLNVCNCIFV